MRAMGFALMTLLLALLATPALADPPDPYSDGPHLATRLVAESDTPAAGSTVMLALDVTPQTGWHGYWQNPGDAGFPAKLDWTLPDGLTAGAAAYPVPTTLLIAGLMNYVFEKHYALLIPVKIPAGSAAGTHLPIKLHAQYLVCTEEICVPETADLSADLTVGDGAVTPARRAQFDAWRQAIPKPLGARATWQDLARPKNPSAEQGTRGAMRIGIPYPASAPLADVYFFPISTGIVDYAAPQKVARDGDRLVIDTMSIKPGGGALAGVLRIGPARGLMVTASPGTVAAAAGGGEDQGAAAPSGSGLWSTVLLALGGAILGGPILNIMPCVFPILSLKALSLARGHLDERAAKREALAYAAGVILVCVALGAAILGLRAGGAAVGWAFQLQDPRAILVLLLLVTAIALNLSGLFEIPTPRFVDSASGASGAFATGALAAIIATPCTGPFMGAALGAALILPWPAALAIFAGLGLGLSLPFLALGFVPALRKMLPKPGVWMETFRHILAVPMWLTALALAWVLGRQAGVDGMTLGLGATLIVAVILWIGGRRQGRGLGMGWTSAAAMIVVAVGGAALVTRAPSNTAQAAVPGGAAKFSEEKLAALLAENKPVFAYFTADWCLTCKVNEKAAIETAAVQKAFKDHGVTTMVGDWTDGDAKLGRFIEAHNRAGVPLYLYYAAGASEPKVLPQILTQSMLVALAAG